MRRSGSPIGLEPPRVAREGTKRALILELLGRDEGASLGELVEATGWQVVGPALLRHQGTDRITGSCGCQAMTGQLRCAVHTRVSTDTGLAREFNSLENQREAAEAASADRDARVA